MLLENIDNQKNEKKQQSNRRYSILLLALLFIGMATYGTYAYFTDSTSVDGNIKLSTGTVSLGKSETSWQSNRTKEQGVDFYNVQPGDVFEKTATVEYTGTLDGIVQVNQFTKEKLIEIANGLDYTIEIVTNKEGNEVTKGDTFEVTLKVTVPGVDKARALEDGRQDKIIDLTGLENAVTFSVQQTGVPTQP